MQHNSKKKIIFVNNNLKSGGIAKALVNLINEIYTDYDITLLLFAKTGQYLSEIPDSVKIIKSNFIFELIGKSQFEFKKNFFLYLIRAFLVILTKIFGFSFTIKLMLLTAKKFEHYYDYAISFHHGPQKRSFYGGCNEFVLYKIDAKQKIGFIHADYIKSGLNTKHNKKLYLKFDKIATVSNGCKNQVLMCIPEISNKMYVVKNCTNYNLINKLINEENIQFDRTFFNIITVSRLSEEKGLLRAVEVIYELIKQNYKIKYHIIGDGPLREKLIYQIKYFNLENYIYLYGNQINPYKYMKNADLFLLPSFHEAAPLVIDEAIAVGIPILTTNTISATEMIYKSKYGWVCDNSKEGIKEYIIRIMNNKEQLYEIRKNFLKEFNNSTPVSQFKSMLND